MKKKKVTPSYRTLLKMDYDQLTNWYIEKNPHLTAKQIEEIWDFTIEELRLYCCTGLTHIKK